METDKCTEKKRTVTNNIYLFIKVEQVKHVRLCHFSYYN